MTEITIMGTGAMAMLMGGRLAKRGVKVHFLGTWKESIAAVNKEGICVIEDGSPRYYPAEAFLDPAQLRGTSLALVLVKSWQTERAARQLSEVLAEDGVALTLQNGLGNGETLGAVLGQDRTALGVTTYGATSLGPGKVRPGGEGIISVGEHPKISALINLLQLGGFTVQQTEDLSGLIWGKLVINVAINPLTGLLGVKNGELLESPAVTRLMGMAAREAAEVARKLGVPISFSDPAQAAETVAAATRENLSSMLQDIRRGAPTEIDALCGAVVRQGKKLGVPTPVNEILALLIQGKVDLSRKEE
ncbi:MAG: 2-dehydropantoate 2-reductase [Chloroflexi bacterium]|nr:MAG: 2-dehydropantoate 2-reductase [Chloroflexota bacterium]